MELEVVTMGRVSVDLYPEQVGVPIAEVRTFAKAVGGSPTNVAVAAARLGRRSAVITKVGDDPFGAYIRAALPERHGVDARWVGVDPTLRTPLAFCEIFPPDHFPLLFYREPKAPDMNLAVADLDLEAIAAAPLFWTTGTGLSDQPSREATLAALAAAVGNQDEVEVAVGTRDPMAASAALLELGLRLAVVKQGPKGVLARTADELVEVPPLPIQILNGLGAGDAFGGSLCHGLLAGWDLERTLRLANAAGAIVASRLLCSDAMPTMAEIDHLLREGPGGSGGTAGPDEPGGSGGALAAPPVGRGAGDA